MVYNRKSYSLTDISVNSISTNVILCNHMTNESFDLSSEMNKSKAGAIKKHNPFLGFFYTFASCVIFALISVMLKKLSYIDVGQLSLIRNAGVFAGGLPVAIYCVTEVFGEKKDRWLLITRGFLGATSFYLYLIAYRYLPLAEAAIILSATPALTIFTAHFYLKESCGYTQTFSLVLTISGVLTSVRLPELLSKRDVTRYDSSYLGGIAAAVGCVLTISITYITLRKMKDIHFSLPMMYMGFLGMIENAAINAVTSTYVLPFCGWDLVMYIVLSVFGFFSTGTFTLAVQIQAAGIVAVLKASMDIIVAILFQVIFFNENPDMYSIIGACLVITSMIIVGIRNWLLMLPEESKARKRLKYFLL